MKSMDQIWPNMQELYSSHYTLMFWCKQTENSLRVHNDKLEYLELQSDSLKSGFEIYAASWVYGYLMTHDVLRRLKRERGVQL